jgi:cytidylate kinase
MRMLTELSREFGKGASIYKVFAAVVPVDQNTTDTSVVDLRNRTVAYRQQTPREIRRQMCKKARSFNNSLREQDVDRKGSAVSNCERAREWPFISRSWTLTWASASSTRQQHHAP